MAHFDYTRPLGVWNPNTNLLASELASLDAKTFKSINGDEGGTWAPSSQIIIGGSGLRVDGPFETRGNTTLGNDIGDTVLVSGSLSVDNLAEFFDGIQISSGDLVMGPGSILANALTVNGTALFNHHVTLGNAATDTVAITGTLAVAQQAAFFNGVLVSSGDLLMGGGAIHGYSADFASLVVFNGPVQLTKHLSITGTGHIRKRVVVAPDSNATYGIDDADEIHIPNTLSAPHAYTLSTLNAVQGAQITAVTYEITHAVTVGGVPMQAQTTGAPFCITWTFDGSAWVVQHSSIAA